MLLLFPLLDLWRRHVLTTIPRPDHPKWMRPLVVVCYFTLLASILLSIVVAAELDATIPLRGTDMEALWRASYILALSVVVLGLFCTVGTHVFFRLRPKGTAYLVCLLLLCLVTGVYRTSQMFTYDETAPIRSRTAFYVLEGATDWLVLVALLAVNLNEWFPGDSLRKYQREQALQRQVKTMTTPVIAVDGLQAPQAAQEGSSWRKWSV